MKPSVIIVACDMLLATGLKRLIQDAFSLSPRIIDAISKPMLLDDFDHIITTPDDFVANLSLLLPRKAQCIIFSNSPLGADGIRFIPRTAPESVIINQLCDYILTPKKPQTQKNALSMREIDVLRLVASGLSNKEIADALCISVNTVLTHRKNISAKLGIKSVSGLSLYAMMNGIIHPYH